MHQESIMNEQRSGKNFEGNFGKLFKLKIMHQELIMNEQNLGKNSEGNFGNFIKLKISHQKLLTNEQNLGNNFEGNLGIFSRWTLCIKNRSWRSKDQAKILREILEIFQIEEYAPRIDNEWLKLRQKIWGKIWKVFYFFGSYSIGSAFYVLVGKISWHDILINQAKLINK